MKCSKYKKSQNLLFYTQHACRHVRALQTIKYGPFWPMLYVMTTN